MLQEHITMHGEKITFTRHFLADPSMFPTPCDHRIQVLSNVLSTVRKYRHLGCVDRVRVKHGVNRHGKLIEYH